MTDQDLILVRSDLNVPNQRPVSREEGIPVLKKKFADSISDKLAAGPWQKLAALTADRDALAATTVDDFMALLVT